MTSHNEQLVSWLNSAYAMEESLARVLENHAHDAAEFPEIRERIEQHIQETRRHSDRVRECLRMLNEKPSMTKSFIGNVTGMVQGASTGMYRDEIVKNALADFASENFEIACYRSLIAACEETGHPEFAAIFRNILQEEEAMAAWLAETIPDITRAFLQREHAHA